MTLCCLWMFNLNRSFVAPLVLLLLDDQDGSIANDRRIFFFIHRPVNTFFFLNSLQFEFSEFRLTKSSYPCGHSTFFFFVLSESIDGQKTRSKRKVTQCKYPFFASFFLRASNVVALFLTFLLIRRVGLLCRYSLFISFVF